MYCLVLLGLKLYKNSILYVVFAIFSLNVIFDYIHITVCSYNSFIPTTV